MATKALNNNSVPSIIVIIFSHFSSLRYIYNVGFIALQKCEKKMSADSNDDIAGDNRTRAKENRILRECVKDAMLYRAVPFSLAASAAVFIAIRRGHYRPTNRFGPWPLVITSSAIAYWSGKLSYILGDNCQDKFLKGAPDSEIAYHIRLQRGMQQPREAREKFDPHFPHHRHNNAVDDDDDERSIQLKEDIESLQSNNATSLDVMMNAGVKLNDRERLVIEECNNCAFYFFSFPTSLLLAGFAYFGQVKGYFRPSERLKPPLTKAPKMIFAVAVGYVIGQYVYTSSSDCVERILTDAPDGELARLIREKKIGQAADLEPELFEEEEEENLPTSELEGDYYILSNHHNSSLQDIDVLTKVDLLNQQK
jgi:hypothetical protein